MLVSLDGTKDRTDSNKGKGSYDFIIKNIKNIREKGFKGEIVARMVVSDFNPDIYEQVKHIVDLIKKGIFDSVHWQIDAGFYKNDYDKDKFLLFVEEYNKSIDKLINFWIDYMKNKRRLLMIYPFVGIFNRLTGKDKETRILCGSGYANYTITTSGKLSACPIMNSVKDFYCGSIKEGVKKEINCHGICDSCDYKTICGGRCLYSNYARLWPEDGEKLICNTIIHLIESLKKKVPEIKELIEKEVISERDFEYEKYFGPEIIP
jgi:putative peptide-modifying radical SAM enzyme